MKHAFLPLLALLISAVLLLGYFEFFSATSYEASHLGDSAHWSLQAFTARSRLLKRVSLQIVVISKMDVPAYCDGHSVTMNGLRMSGRKRVYLIDERGQLTESKAPVFQEFWQDKRDVPGFKKDGATIEAVETSLQVSMREWFPPARRDKPLDDFLADPSPKK